MKTTSSVVSVAKAQPPIDAFHALDDVGPSQPRGAWDGESRRRPGR
ncbi:hypothetical protein [Onishia taeanensis]